MEGTFKTAMFGGFDKQSVVDYIEKSARESRECIAALESECTALQAGKAEAEERCAALREENEGLKDESVQLRTELAEVRSEKAQLEARLAEMEREYQTYRAHMVDIELEARQRAGDITNQAQTAADELTRTTREQADAMLQDAQNRCVALRNQMQGELQAMIDGCRAMKADFANMTEHISSELRRMDVATAQLPLSFNHLQAGLEALARETAEQ